MRQLIWVVLMLLIGAMCSPAQAGSPSFISPVWQNTNNPLLPGFTFLVRDPDNSMPGFHKIIFIGATNGWLPTNGFITAERQGGGLETIFMGTFESGDTPYVSVSLLASDIDASWWTLENPPADYETQRLIAIFPAGRYQIYIEFENGEGPGTQAFYEFELL